jgi:zinc protease
MGMKTDQDDVYRTVLDNGLTVLLKENHAAPVASCWIFYRVGGRNEVAGLTGISHWTEHMMFKGTPTFPKGEIMRLVNKNGGTLNASTSEDYTSYYETLPADRIELGLRIEADRMANSAFDAGEVEAERTVILSERQGSENSPNFLLYEEVAAAAFRVHPYGHQVIGWKEDLKRITRDDLWQHYRTYYGPHNAVLVLAGDFETSAMLELVETHFGPIPAGPQPPPMNVVEPPQRAERRVTVRQPGTTAYFQAVYHVPNARHPDYYPLLVLDSILSGAKPMCFSSSSAVNKSARLYRALVETGLATLASSSFGSSLDPHLFGFAATVRAGSTLEAVEGAMLAEMRRVIDEPVGDAELSKAIKQSYAEFAFANESVSNQAYCLGDMEMVESYRRHYTFFDRLSAVTTRDVQRVAQTYLQPAHHTIGWFAPEEQPGG